MQFVSLLKSVLTAKLVSVPMSALQLRDDTIYTHAATALARLCGLSRMNAAASFPVLVILIAT